MILTSSKYSPTIVRKCLGEIQEEKHADAGVGAASFRVV